MSQRIRSNFRVGLCCLALFCAMAAATAAAAQPAPNVVILLADDLGYGDLSCYGATKIQTPNIDRLAKEGMRFTDAHTPSAVCSPTRYGLITGRYCWRTWLKSNVLDGFDPPLIEPGRLTIASYLKGKGYETAAIGKWHIGMTWTTTNGQAVPFRRVEAGFRLGRDIDYSQETRGGPVDCGFDSWFGISGSLDMSPYAFVQNRRISPPPTEWTGTNRTLFLNQGPGVQPPGFKLEDALPTFTRKAVEFIRSRHGSDPPFFLYLAFPSPHLPIVPTAEWQGKSRAGTYGDYVQQTDASVGEVLAALSHAKLSRNTLVFFTSDNGGLWHSWKPQEADDVKGYRPTPRGLYVAERGHYGNGKLRGTKADIYEGGHRVPLIVRWPGAVKPGVATPALVELNDIFATLVEILGDTLPQNAGEDSISLLPVLRGASPDHFKRTFAVHHSLQGLFALREGPWKFISARGSGGFSIPKTVTPQAGEPTGALYNLENDLQETTNVWHAEPERVERMRQRLQEIQRGDRTRP